MWWRVQRTRAATERAAQRLAEATPGEGDAWVWREIPPDCREPKLVLGYDREWDYVVLQYPTVRPAGHVRFAGGTLRLMTGSALERTLAADNDLRDRLGLTPAEEPDSG